MSRTVRDSHVDSYALRVVNVLAGIVGALLGFSGALLGAWIKSRDEHRKWLRDQKLECAAEMISAGANIYEFHVGSKVAEAFEPGELREWAARLGKARSVVHLLCAQETRDHADSFVRSCWRAKPPEDMDKFVVAVKEFNTSLRREIGTG
jgi:hypothetical protein